MNTHLRKFNLPSFVKFPFHQVVGIFVLWCSFSLIAADQELIRDPHFQHGFHLLEPKPGQRIVYGKLAGLSSSAPFWDLGQWSSRFPLQTTNTTRHNHGMQYTNSAKKVIVGQSRRAEADLSLGVNASLEYDGHARQSGEEPWVHLLVQQDFENAPSLGSISDCHFHLEARLKKSTLQRTPDYTPHRHAAQFFVYIAIANRNPKSPGYQQYFWFGIPVYDDRARVIPAYQAQDFGQSKMFIYTPSSDVFTQQSTQDEKWVTFDNHLLPLIQKGLETGRAKGFLQGSNNLDDYRPTGIFIGWEVPGLFDVDLQIRSLSLKVTPTK